ncbi:MAG: hypothetical protein JXR70_04830 [Spirochaetales bacterium]|nr:hypothetical protein [Spirochaetales bacterium]
MTEQYKANQFLKSSHWTSDLVSTRALDTNSDSIIENYEQFYATEMDIINRVNNTKLRIKKDLNYMANYPLNPDSDITDHRPFLPGLYADTPTGYKNSAESLYQPDKSAGIDSKGLVSGALSMAGIGGVMNIFNQDISQNLGAYYSMSNELPGLDDNGKPAFYISKENSILTGDYCLSKTDIERTTILVPDVSLIQKGDLLVNYMADNELHLGVIVDFPWAKDSDKKPGYGEDLGTIWDEIYVVSVRKGFQTVVLGTWGNGGNIFSGFSENPETYQIRRLVKQQSANLSRGAKKEDWDVTGFIPKRIYTNYPAPNTYPIGHARTNVYYPYVENLTPQGAYDTLNNVNHDVEYHRARIGVLDRIRNGAFSYEKKQNKTDSENEKWGPVSENLFYWDYLPPTSFENKWAQSPFGPDEKMDVVGITGWRDLGWRKFEGYKDAIHPEKDIEAQLIDYHTAIDITYPNSSESFLHPLYAPEDGIFYIFGNENSTILQVNKEENDEADKLLMNDYRDSSAGFITVFISNKKNTQDTTKSRVYLFTHCGPPHAGQNTVYDPPKPDADFASTLQLFKDRFESEYPGVPYPDSYDKAIPVKTGQWIGLLGQRGAAISVHSHLEVFEYFEKDEAFLDSWNPKKKDAQGNWIPDGIQFNAFGKWKRINPLTLFRKKDYNSIPDYHDNVQNLRDLSDFSQEEMDKVFRTWDNRIDKE